jgi:mRNA interferase YafQ
MRTIEQANSFKRDYKRVQKNAKQSKDINKLLGDVLTLLASDMPLPTSNKDHSLTGNWVGYRDCHIKPDLVLIYKKSDENSLRLARLGSHSDIFS